MKLYQYYQPNKKDFKDRQGDCAIRAITKFFNISWLEAFDGLVQYARETQKMVNSKDNLELYMKDRGLAYTSIYNPKAKNKITVSEFAKKHKTGTFILYVRTGYNTHLVCCSDGQYFDTWDCGKRIVYGYYGKEEKGAD